MRKLPSAPRPRRDRGPEARRPTLPHSPRRRPAGRHRRRRCRPRQEQRDLHEEMAREGDAKEARLRFPTWPHDHGRVDVLRLATWRASRWADCILKACRDWREHWSSRSRRGGLACWRAVTFRSRTSPTPRTRVRLEAGPLPDSAAWRRDAPTAFDGGVDAADGGCAGPTCVGTFVSGATGSDSNPGTSAKPVQTITKAIAIAVALGGKQSVYVAAAHYPEKVTLSEGVDLLGGYDCSATSCTWARDASTNDTAILDQDFEGVLAPKAVTRKTLFDGFRVVGKGGVPSAAPGSAAMSLVGGTPTIAHCRLVGGDVTGGAPNATVDRRSRSFGAPTDCGRRSRRSRMRSLGGASTDQSVGVHFARGRPPGSTGRPWPSSTSNRIRGGAAPLRSESSRGRAAPERSLMSNDIAAGDLDGRGSSWGIIVMSTMTIDANRINADPAVARRARAQSAAGISVAASIARARRRRSSTTSCSVAPGPRTCAVLLTDGEVGLGTRDPQRQHARWSG